MKRRTPPPRRPRPSRPPRVIVEPALATDPEARERALAFLEALLDGASDGGEGAR
jgi:hypothetical protein